MTRWFRITAIFVLLAVCLPASAGVWHRTPDDPMGLLLDLDFTNGMTVNTSWMSVEPTFTRASEACRYYRSPADNVAVNVPRYDDAGRGILIEGADQNLILQNTVYAGGNWTTNGNITPTDDTDVDLYDGHSFKLVEAAGVGQIYQSPTLTAVNHIVSALCYTNGSAVTTADADAFADTATTNKIGTTYYEDLGGGVYLVWGEFTATAAAWNVGIEVKANKTAYVSLITCHLSAPASEGGSFPRSPIVNATGAAITRAAESLTIPSDDNFNPLQGTIDMKVDVPCSEAEAATTLHLLAIYKDGDNRILLDYRFATNTLQVRVEFNNIAAECEAAVPLARGETLKVRIVWNRAEKVDGTNYLVVLVDNGSGWSQLCQSATQPGVPAFAGGTIHIGSNQVPIYHLGSFIRRLVIRDRAVLNPNW